jgi:hypothetical protein
MNDKEYTIQRILKAINLSVMAEMPVTFTHTEAAIIGELIKIAVTLITGKLEDNNKEHDQ